MQLSSATARIWRVSIWGLTIAITTTWIVYILVGRQLITALSHSQNSAIADRLMAGRVVTPLDAYYRHADALMVHATLWLVATYLALWLLLRHALGVFLAVFSFFVSSFLLFCLFETFPSLIPLTHLDDFFGYYAYKTNYIPDPELVFREKPFNRRIIPDFAGTQYSPRYGIEVQPYTIEWIMDKDGFRNQRVADSADVVVLGDSYIEYGSTEADTFVGRLEQILGGMTVRNLGKSGYGPAQYLQALKRFGLPDKPRIAVMAFYEGNDIPEVRDYLFWKSGRTSELRGYLFKFATDSLWRRYTVAVAASLVELRNTAGAFDEVFLQKLAAARSYPQQTHPDIAILNLGGQFYPKLFIDKLPETTADQMLATHELRAIGNIFDEFREVCKANRITPVILYIPTALQIYAPYTTAASGSHWLPVRDRQIAVRENVEKAITILANESGVDLISLTPEFQRAAAKGKMIYYALDAHWNEEGREIAARFIGGLLKNRYL
jgi:acetyltransferase AlgX (SGNH hydrolase-like protein)